MEAKRDFEPERSSRLEANLLSLPENWLFDFQLNVSEEERMKWETVVGGVLDSWIEDPGLLLDGEIDPPDPILIRDVRKLSSEIHRSRLPVPDHVLPNGDSGIVFEWDDGNKYVSLEFRKDFSIEILISDGDQLFRRTIV